jgi:hypothetical protein
MATSAPSRANSTATARPMPLSPPVIRATLPASLPLPWCWGRVASGVGVISCSIPGWVWRWGGCSWSSSGMGAPFGMAVVVAEIAKPSGNCRNRHRQAAGHKTLASSASSPATNQGGRPHLQAPSQPDVSG